jgi:hypothetical protein
MITSHHLSTKKLTISRQEELHDIVLDAAADSTDSPDIGPPPVSQFVDEDPVKIDLPTRPRKKENVDGADLDPVLSMHLEQRRKRKDSTSSSEARRASKSDHLLDTRENTGSLKTGAKRKLSVREDEERDIPAKQTEDSPGDFKFTRGVSEERTRMKSGAPSEKPLLKATRELAIARGAPREKQSTLNTTSTRKVLAPKSVNNSPKKTTRAQIVEEMKIAKADHARASSITERPRERRQDVLSIQPPSTAPPVDSVEIQPEPETPAGLDLFSPSSSQPSTARAESRDTPPPPDLGPGTEGQRPSRRARGAVSYAEPNLRDKMRRPTKELVDAVISDDKAHRKSFIMLEDDTNPVGMMTIKAEPEADDAWKRMPLASSSTVENSPLSGKLSVPDSLPSSITTHRKRRESLLQQTGSDVPRSNSVNAISALLASNRNAKADAKEKEKEKEKEKGLRGVSIATATGEDIDIYELRGSSPIAEGDQVKGEVLARKRKEEKPISRFSRRHSTMSRDMSIISDSEASDIDASRKEKGSSSRRRQSSLAIQSTSTKTGPSKGDDTEKGLKKATTTAELAESGVDSSRGGRIAARRRSMML